MLCIQIESSISRNGIHTNLLCSKASTLEYSLKDMFLLAIKSINRTIGLRNIKRTERTTLGFKRKAPVISKCKNFKVALVMPHPGHCT